MRSFSGYWVKVEAVVFGLSLFISILMASVGSRIGTIFQQPLFEEIKFATFAICSILAFIILFKKRWKWAIFTSFFALSIIAHAFALFYQPSFAPYISFQDYFLGDIGSSNWSLNVAILFLRNFFQFMLPALAVFVVSKPYQKLLIKLVILAFIIGFLSNSALAIYQGLVDLTFWAEGSGTAVSARRAAAFLEDSGASSVYFAAMSMAMFWSLVFTRSMRLVLASGTVLFIGFAGGMFAGGKVFLTSCLVSMSLGLFISIIQSLNTRNRNMFFLLLLLSSLVVGVSTNIFFIHKTESSSILTDFVISITEKNIPLAEALENLDASRLFHMKVMWKVFCENFWTGTGLGSFLANLSNNAPKNMPSDWFDWPSSFYLMLMSELGLVGLVLVILLISTWLNQVLFLLKGKALALQLNASDEQTLLQAIVPASTGAMTSLLVSLLIGVHLIYPINSAIAAFSLAVALATMPAMKESLEYPSIFAQCWRRILPVCTVYLLLISTMQALDPPRVPEFHWLERGKPQIPVHIRQELEGKKGYWIPRATEILVESQKTYLYIKHPDELFPVTVNVKFINTTAQKVDSQQFKLRKRQWFAIELPPQLREECLAPQNPSSFCSLRLKISPVWYYEGLEMGVFVANPKADSPAKS